MPAASAVQYNVNIQVIFFLNAFLCITSNRNSHYWTCTVVLNEIKPGGKPVK